MRAIEVMERLVGRVALVALVLAFGVATSGCSSDPDVDLQPYPGPPGSQVEATNLVLHVGTALSMNATARDGDKEVDDATITFDTDGAIEVVSSTTHGVFVFVARRVGDGRVSVRVNGKERRFFSTHVTP